MDKFHFATHWGTSLGRPMILCGTGCKAEPEEIGESIMKHTNAERELAERMNEIRLKLIEYGTTHTLNELATKALDEICAHFFGKFR